MRGLVHQFTNLLVISIISSLSIPQHHSLNISRRRILHQPLFPLPTASPPPPPPPSAEPPPPPDQPFFLEQPNSPLPTQPPPPPSTAAATAAKTPQSKPTNGIAIAISVGTVTLGMISAFAFYLYKHRANKTLRENQSEMLVGEDIPAASRDHTYLYVGTVNPAAAGGTVADVAMVNSSPYRKLNSVKRSDRYRPSPELQPMPPLPKQSFNSPLGRFSSFAFGFSPKRPKFAPPPPPPDTARLQSIVTSKPPAPPPPPPPPSRQVASKSTVSVKKEEMRVTEEEGRIDDENRDRTRPTLKPLHWDKVRATSGKATVWDQLKSSSFQLDEDKMETLFGNNSRNSAPKESTRKSVRPSIECENRVLDPKKSQNIAILLRALNVTKGEVSEALLEGNLESMSADLLETLVKMAPTKEEEIKLKEYKGDIMKLGSAERFLRTVIDIPFAFKRVEAMVYRANFDAELKDLRKSFQTLEAASEELKTSRLFLKLIEAVLRTGNRMNVGTNRGDARAFKLDTLLKLTDVKGKDGKTTLLHFVIQEIIRSEGVRSDPTAEMNLKLNQGDFKKQGLKIVSGLCKELENVKKAANMDADVLRSYVSKLETGLEKVKAVLQYEELNSKGRFFESMKMFLKGAGDDIARIKAHERKALSVVREVTEYFHGNMAKDETRPLGIFMIVRDCLYTLENVCKEVGKIHDNTVVGSARSFRMPPTAFLPVVSRYNMRHESSSDDDSSEP